jgi:hypothetical protein
MRASRSRFLVRLVTAAIVASAGTAHASDERRGGKVGSGGPFQAAQLPGAPAPALDHPEGDPLADGIAIGALIGAGTGLGLMAWAYEQCDGSCDAPEPAPMYLMAGGMGAAVGGVVGFLVDKLRKNTSRRRVTFTAIATPRRSQVGVGVRW